MITFERKKKISSMSAPTSTATAASVVSSASAPKAKKAKKVLPPGTPAPYKLKLSDHAAALPNTQLKTITERFGTSRMTKNAAMMLRNEFVWFFMDMVRKINAAALARNSNIFCDEDVVFVITRYYPHLSGLICDNPKYVAPVETAEDAQAQPKVKKPRAKSVSKKAGASDVEAATAAPGATAAAAVLPAAVAASA